MKDVHEAEKNRHEQNQVREQRTQQGRILMPLGRLVRRPICWVGCHGVGVVCIHLESDNPVEVRDVRVERVNDDEFSFVRPMRIWTCLRWDEMMSFSHSMHGVVPSLCMNESIN